uniref:RING-type domain-containing protein n=1 Tax=Leersia perrieri TaxID=77586 RepID=A0A0D9W8Q8_9ORYZ
MASTLPSPSPPSAGAAADPITGSSSDPAASSFLPSLLIIAALLAFVLLASVSIHLLLRLLSRSPSPPSSPPLPRTTHREERAVEADANSSVRRHEVGSKKEVVAGDEKQRLIESLPLFTMASSLAALPKSSPDCAVCLSPFTPDAELRLLPACRHAFHTACVDAWLRTTPSCPLCRATVTLHHPSISAILAAEHPPPPSPPSQPRGSSRVRPTSFRVEIGSVVSNRATSTAAGATYSLGSFDYHIDEEVEAVVSRAAAAPAMAARSAAAIIKEDKPAVEHSPPPPGEAVAEAAGGGTRGWLREYVERLASSASSSLSFSGRWSSRWSQSHHSQRQEEPWLWDAEAVRMSPPGTEEEETPFMVLYRWIAGV